MVSMTSALVSLAVCFLCFSKGMEASTTVTIVTTSSTTTTTTKTEPTSPDETSAQPAPRECPRECPAVTPEPGSTSDEVRGIQEKFLNLSVDPLTIIEGVTSQLTINCSFLGTLSADVSSFGMMSIFRSRETSRGLEKQEIDTNPPKRPNNPPPAGFEILKKATPNGLSYMNVKINNPTANDSGVYSCHVTGLDTQKEPFLVTAFAEVHVHGSSRRTRNSEPMMADSPADSSESIKALLKQIEDLQRSLDKITPNVTALAQFQTNFNARLSNARQSLFPYSMKYATGTYLVSSVDFTHAKIAPATCELFGGHLAESDSLEEYNNMKNFTGELSEDSEFSDASGVLIGGTDEADEGYWRTRKSEVKLPYLDWDIKYPNKDKTLNCIMLSRDAGWKMRDIPCKATQSHVRFMCEIPPTP